MTPRGFLILCAATAVAVAVATGVVLRQDRPETVVGSGEKVFPELLEKIDDRLAAIRVRTADATLTVRRTAHGWALAERADYPVAPERVRATVLGLATLERGEPKTARPENFARLGVADVETAGATGREVSLLDDRGEPLAQLIIGKPAPAQGGEGGLYVRVLGEPRAWTARGSLDPGAEPRDWVQRRLIDIPAEALVRITIRHPDRSTLTLTRGDGAEATWTLKELPRGARLRRADDLDAIAAVLAGLSLDDLRPRTELAFAREQTITARFETGDGRQIGLELLALGDERWIRLEPAANDGRPGGQPGSERLRDWAYRVPAWKVAPLQRRLADLVDSPPPSP